MRLHRAVGTFASLRRWSCGVILVLASASSLLSQIDARPNFPLSLADSAPDWMVRLDKPTGCLASIPPSSMHRVPVVLEASVSEHADTALTLQTDLMAQDVSEQFRMMMGAKGTEVPTADSNFVWYSVPTELVVIAHRNGDMTARARSSGGDSAATALLTRAFDTARARGTARIFWPEGLKADSILVRLALWPMYVGDSASASMELGNGRKFVTFYHTEPERTAPIPLRDQEPPNYPMENKWNRFEGYVLMQFVVDTNGRTEASTIQDLWPAGKPRLSGELRAAYDEFVHSVRVWETNLRFEPARIGPCAVKQQERQPLVFKFRPRR
jgi:hypothetical protein